MNKTRRLRTFVLAFVLVLAAGLIGGAITERLNYAAPTEAQRTDRPPVRTPDRWDYCALSKAAVGASRGGLYSISYFRDGGAQVVEAEELATERDGPARAIALLGQAGWEMVGEGPLDLRAGSTNAIYFKRLRR
jgi:hypothetical protein